MSVIAKMSIRAITSFSGAAKLLDMSCICDNDLMAAYATSEEDKLFTKYSPWGEIKLHQDDGYALGEEGDYFYVMLMRTSEVQDFGFAGAYASLPVKCVSLTDFGDGQAKRVEFTDGWRKVEKGKRAATKMNWKMSVDNPGATVQFLPGVDDYWVAFYPAKVFDRDGVIRAAHSK